tara:strand:+ start:145 stop:420 length:276 start_codon:yes stop_codon:yes gene_type:complete
MPKHGPQRVSVPERPANAKPYNMVFTGKSPTDKGRLSQIQSLGTYVPLYDFLKANPSAAARLDPDVFTWMFNNITYSSGWSGTLHLPIFIC